MISYVLLIVIALAMAAAVWAWLKFYVPTEDQETCSLDVSLVVTRYICHNSANELEIDVKNNRLLFAVKEYNNRKDTKGIYAFDLSSKSLEKGRHFTLDGNDEIYRNLVGGRSSRIIRPSAIRFHPKTGELYVLEGNQPKLIILDEEGNEVKIHILNTETFPQPEALDFDEENRLYISN